MNDTVECTHHVDFDRLIAQYREAEGFSVGSPRRIRFAAECSRCHSLVSLDAILTHLLMRIFDLENAVQLLVKRLGPELTKDAEASHGESV